MSRFRGYRHFDLVLSTSGSAQSLGLCRSRCTKYPIEMLISPELWHALQAGMYCYRAVQGGFVRYLSTDHCYTVPTEYNYLFVLAIPKLSQVCTSMYLVHTGTYQEKPKRWMRITWGIEPRISCIASCTLYHCTTRIHFMVISLVNTRCIDSKIYTGVARYLLGKFWLV